MALTTRLDRVWVIRNRRPLHSPSWPRKPRSWQRSFSASLLEVFESLQAEDLIAKFCIKILRHRCDDRSKTLITKLIIELNRKSGSCREPSHFGASYVKPNHRSLAMHNVRVRFKLFEHLSAVRAFFRLTPIGDFGKIIKRLYGLLGGSVDVWRQHMHWRKKEEKTLLI